MQKNLGVYRHSHTFELVFLIFPFCLLPAVHIQQLVGCKDVACTQVDWCLSLGRIWYRLLQFQLVKHTLVQLALFRPAVPELLVVVLKTLPVGAELTQAVLVDVLDNARGTPGDLAALLHALEFTPAVGLGLAHHVVIVEGLAARTNKVRGTEEGRRTGSELLDLGDVVRQRSCVDEGLLVEPGLARRHGGGWVPMADYRLGN